MHRFNHVSATGLYYLAELIEEYTVKAKKIVRIMVWVSMYVCVRCDGE